MPLATAPRRTRPTQPQHGVVTALCVGNGPEVAKQPVDRLVLTPLGIEGDRHAGATRVPRYGRNKGQVVFNERSWSAVSDEEVAEIEQRLGITLPVGALGENLRIAGIPRLSKVRPGTRLAFPCGAVLIVSAESLPCGRAGASLAALCGRPELRAGFVHRSRGLRGLVGWVEVPGEVHPGDDVVFTFGE